MSEHEMVGRDADDMGWYEAQHQLVVPPLPAVSRLAVPGLFPWQADIQRYLVTASVRASMLHGPTGWAACGALAECWRLYGTGCVRILSAVRTTAEQEALYYQICVVQRRCDWVANPDTVWGQDLEGFLRKGSNHQQQWRNGDPLSVGFATDLRSTIAWNLVHQVFARWGFRFPMSYEPWHAELYSRTAMPASGPWPRVCESRVIRLGDRGGDVATLQRTRLGVAADGKAGPATVLAIKALEKRLGLPVDGIWSPADERAAAQPPAPTPPTVAELVATAQAANERAIDATRRAKDRNSNIGVESRLSEALHAGQAMRRALAEAAGS